MYGLLTVTAANLFFIAIKKKAIWQKAAIVSHVLLLCVVMTVNREGEQLHMCIHVAGWLAGGHQAERGALLKTICFAAKSQGCVDTLS